MKKIFGLIKRHKLLFLLCFLAIIIVMFLGYIFFDAFISGDGVYGDPKGLSGYFPCYNLS